MDDRKLLFIAAFLRALALGMIGVLLAIYFAKLRYTPSLIGAIISIGLVGGALAALLVTFFGDDWGRRQSLVAIALLSAGGGFIIAFASNVMIVAIAAFVGILNSVGRDRGAALILEQAILPATVPDAERTKTFAIYNFLQDVGLAMGGLLATIPSLLHKGSNINDVWSFRVAILLYAFLMLATVFCYLKLSSKVEVSKIFKQLKISKQSKTILLKLSGLFAIDSISGGFLSAALLSYFFFERFGVNAAVIAILFFFGRGMNALSYLGATWLAKRIGLVNTMVFTHIPSSLILIVIALVPGNIFLVAAILYILREALVEMDVPARESYVMAVIKPEERTFASGITHIVRIGGWAIAPVFAGALMQYMSLAMPLIIGAIMKMSYDIMLYFSFRKVKPPEEQ